MSYKWASLENAGGSIGGILRKNVDQSMGTNGDTQNSESKAVDLLVFGYACKVFRDDDKAREIDQGKHLIPWMGENSLKIDRYDVRGALCDLAPHEAPPGGYGNRLDYLTSEEQRAEQLCEEERYFYLFRNEGEDILYQEEDIKRLKQDNHGYSQVGFQYDDYAVGGTAIQHGPSNEASSSPTNETEQPFELPPNFELPPSIQLPKTIKQHAIIEKTARFIMSQGAQMEILIKAKQSNNLQFEFLNQNSILNPYYKAMLNALRNGTYPTEIKYLPSTEDVVNEESEKQNRTMEVVSKPAIIVPTIKYKPSANCAYTQLISKIKGTPLPPPDLNDNSSNPGVPEILKIPNNNPITTNLTTYTKMDNNDGCDNKSQNISEIKNENNTDQVTVLKSSNALMLAQCYSSETESEEEQVGELHFPIPPDYLQNVIDKTAGYVIKNGRHFEDTLRTKNDERFTFLWHDNEFYPYYMYKITGDPDAAKKEKKVTATIKDTYASESDNKRDKIIGPVCFSIKTREDAASACLAISEDGSDIDEEKRTQVCEQSTSLSQNSEQNQQTKTVPEHVQKAIKLIESQLTARNAQMGIRTRMPIGMISSNHSIQLIKSPFDIDQTLAPATIKTTSLPSNVSLLSNLAATTSSSSGSNFRSASLQQNQQKVLKRAEDKVKDKLAQIAREKLGGLLSKEKQLQCERKRKAMAFLNHIKGTPTGSPIATTSMSTDNSPKPFTASKDASDSDDMSVHSIPISSYGGDDDKTDEEEIIEIEMEPSSNTIIQTEEKLTNRVKLSPNLHDIKSKETKRLKREPSYQEILQIPERSISNFLRKSPPRVKESRHSNSRRKSKHRNENVIEIRSIRKSSKSRSPSLHRKRSHRRSSHSPDCSKSYRHQSRSQSREIACSSHCKNHKRSSSRKHKKRRKHHH